MKTLSSSTNLSHSGLYIIENSLGQNYATSLDHSAMSIHLFILNPSMRIVQTLKNHVIALNLLTIIILILI